MQRLLFLCGSLVPGEDGVGDYTRKLAAELIASGITVRLVATHDKGVQTAVEENQVQGGTGVRVLRIPYGAAPADRVQRLQALLDAFDPDWLSLQYVPYSFSPQGVPFALIRQLRRLRHRGGWHVMFHELWIKQRGILTPKDTAVSTLQRLVVLALGRSLQPRVVHTHIPFYQTRLRRLGITARPLPLFANIAPRDAAPPHGSGEAFRLGFFSQFIPERVIPFIRELAGWLRETDGRRLEIHLLGGGAAKVADTRRVLTAQLPDATVIATGFLPADALSRELSNLDLGITPVDHHLIGKSGTVAAFLNHGIPVAAPYRTAEAFSFFDAALSTAVMETFTPRGLAAATQAARSLDTTAIAPEGVARCFIADLGLTAEATVPNHSGHPQNNAH